ncbi:MAG: DNA-binding response regulator [Betaproteobacteria bacterium RIFCSPLOWO2_02_FULL_62_17]|nr:MAG: DNA-binding response regulator [Betaproteobacteria bacterium RIFCSPLOWO2_02_FULL_62_17]
MTAIEHTVFIIDDDPSVRDALGLLLGVSGYRTMIFGDAESFRRAFSQDSGKACLLVDIRMPGMDGLALQKWLLQSGASLPVIVMTGHGNVDSAREAFRAHAIDFLEKPINQHRLLAAIEEAMARQSIIQQEHERNAVFTELSRTLTPREKEVMAMVVSGRHNREIAESLDISSRTVEVHKARVMQKLKVDSIAQLVRMSLGVSSDKEA